MKEPALLEEVKTKLAARFADVDSEVVEAVESLEVRQWVYLRDTKLHSIFVDQSTDRVFGVVGLTERLRDILGGSVFTLKLVWFDTEGVSFAMG